LVDIQTSQNEDANNPAYKITMVVELCAEVERTRRI
jgi:hypothetical protein